MLTLERPKSEIKRVYLIARDAETGKSRSLTVYGVTPEEVIEKLKAICEQSSEDDADSQNTSAA